MTSSVATVTKNFIKTDSGNENVYVSLAHIEKLVGLYLETDDFYYTVVRSAKDEIFKAGAGSVRKVESKPLIGSDGAVDGSDLPVGETETGQVISIEVKDGKGVNVHSEHFNTWYPFKSGRTTVTAVENEDAISSTWDKKISHGRTAEGAVFRVTVVDGKGVSVQGPLPDMSVNSGQFIPFKDSTGTLNMKQLIDGICHSGDCLSD